MEYLLEKIFNAVGIFAETRPLSETDQMKIPGLVGYEYDGKFVPVSEDGKKIDDERTFDFN